MKTELKWICFRKAAACDTHGQPALVIRRNPEPREVFSLCQRVARNLGSDLAAINLAEMKYFPLHSPSKETGSFEGELSLSLELLPQTLNQKRSTKYGYV